MKDLKEQAKKAHEHKLEKYGGHVRHHAHGGAAKHSDVKEDEALIRKEVKPEALKHHTAHKAVGGPILGGRKLPALGRHRRPGIGKKGTNVNVLVGKPGADGPGAGPALPPPPIGAGAPMPPPRPAMPPRPPVGPGPGVGPMKKGGAAKKRHDREHHKAHH